MILFILRIFPNLFIYFFRKKKYIYIFYLFQSIFSLFRHSHPVFSVFFFLRLFYFLVWGGRVRGGGEKKGTVSVWYLHLGLVVFKLLFCGT